MHKHVRSTGIAAGLVSVLFATAAHAEDETREAWRLFVTDQEQAKVSVIDPADGTLIDTYATTGYVTHLVPSESGATLAAVQMDHDVVHVIKSGITLSGHGDHSDIEVGAPALLPVTLTGKRPVHAVMHGDEIVQFFDREGEARAYREKDLLEGDAAYEAVKATAPHHGVAVPMGDYFLISTPNLDVETKVGDLPPRLGLNVLDESGGQIGETAPCTGLHGEAYSAGFAAFGCDEGVLLARPDGGNAPKVDMLAYGDDLPEGRVSHLIGGKAMQFFFGDYGADKLAIIDPSSEAPYRIVDLPVRHVHFLLDDARVKYAYVFTEDGQLHAVDVLSGAVVRSRKITDPYSKDGHWRDPRPRIALMHDLIAVTDPREHLVRLVDAESFEEVRTIPVEGLPFNVVAIGGSGLEH